VTAVAESRISKLPLFRGATPAVQVQKPERIALALNPGGFSYRTGCGVVTEGRQDGAVCRQVRKRRVSGDWKTKNVREVNGPTMQC
jgi:hypothetical protein